MCGADVSGDFMKYANIISVELDGLDTKDYPDFCDAHVCYAEHPDGTPLSEAELDDLNDNHSDIVHAKAHEHFF